MVELSEELRESVDAFVVGVTQTSGGDDTKGALWTGKETLQLLKRIIGQSKWSTAAELLDMVRLEGQELCERVPSEAVVGNLIRRVLKLIRDEYHSAIRGRQEEDDTQDSLHKMMVSSSSTSDLRQPIPDLKSKIMESVEELMMELETSSEEIATQALEHIHANEVILTLGRSKTVERFLKHAAKERKFQVIVAECAPFYHGQEMATSLAKAKIQTTVITDSAIFAIMSRVNKVIIGTNSILANGGLRAVCGSHTVALSAKHYSVPLYVCASMLKLTPTYACDSEEGNKFVSPHESLRGLDGKILSRISSVTPVFEYVPPDLVTLFISNLSGHAPSYVYRLLAEIYHPDDYELTASS